MSAEADADWTRLLASVEHLGELYGDAPPAPDECTLFYVHIDERGPSVTLGFDTLEFPANPRPEWREKGLNAFQFHLVFSAVEEVRVTGWGAAQAKEIHLRAADAGTFTVTLGSERSGITFRSPTPRLTRPRAYLASPSP